MVFYYVSADKATIMAALMALLVFILGISSSSACGRSSNTPSFCGQSECPEFTVLETTEVSYVSLRD